MTGTELPDFPASQLFLRRLAYRLVRDEALAEDLVQDTWAAWIRHGPRGLAEPRAWLARVLRNRAFNATRAAERRAGRERAAARADPGEPETDGTLEAQAHLVAALRELAEPYRSTLVQRYYHDLTPREIAARTGSPLETVRSRLARGLAKLREELDRRHGGDRAAWCHWLANVGHASAPLVDLTAGGGASAGPLLTAAPLLAVVLVVGVVLVIRESVSTARRGSVHSSDRATDGQPNPITGAAERRDHFERRAESAPARESRAASDSSGSAEIAASPALSGQSEQRSSAGFEWRQLDGSPAHDRRHAAEDRIARPKVFWFVPGLHGQPTLSRGRLYAGGNALVQVEPVTGRILNMNCEAPLPAELRDLIDTGHDARAFERLRDAPRVGPAPAITDELVLARDPDDGSIAAFEGEKLAWSRWHWKPGEEMPSALPGCLVGDLYLVPSGSNLFALDVRDGRVRWKFGEEGRDRARRDIRSAPAVAGDHVFLWLGDGSVIELDLRNGKKWREETAMSPRGLSSILATGNSLVVASAGAPGDPSSGELLSLRFLDEPWSLDIDGLPGLHPEGGALLVTSRGRLAVVDEREGVIDQEVGFPVESPRGVPGLVGTSLYSAGSDGTLTVHDFATGALRWQFATPAGAPVEDFVHAGDMLFVVTSIGLFAIGDDPEAATPANGHTVQWFGDIRRPSARRDDR